MLGELGTAFGIGLLATLSPCGLPLYPGFLAYLAAGGPDRSGSARRLAVFVLAGVLTMMMALGAIIAALSLAVGQVLVFVTPLADVLVIALGLALALGRNPFARLPVLAGDRPRGSPARSAYVYGLMYGPVAMPCSGTLLVSVLTLSLSVDSFVEKLLFFLAFALGFGVPLLAISLIAEASRYGLLRLFTRHHAAISRVAGVILIVVGAWDLRSNLPFVRLYLGI